MSPLPVLTWEAAIGNDPLDTSPTYTAFNAADGSTRLVSASVSRALGRAGSSTSVLDNTDGALNQWNTASPYFGNLLTANQASLETGTTGWAVATNCSLGRSSSHWTRGTWSLTMTPTVTGNMAAMTLDGVNGVPVVAGQVYTGAAQIQSASTGRGAFVRVAWYNTAGTFISSTDGPTVTDNSSSWSEIYNLGVTAPAGAAYANIVVVVNSANEVHYLDAIVFQGGSSTAWTPGGRGGNMQPVLKVRCRAQWNLLTANQASVETNTVGLTGRGNCNISRNTTQAADGTASLAVTAIALGSMQAGTSIQTAGVPVVPGEQYTGVVWFKNEAGTTSQTAVVLDWWRSDGTIIISNQSPGYLTSVSSEWRYASVTATAPPGAAYTAVSGYVQLQGMGTSIFMDKFGLFRGSDTTWSPGGSYYLFTQFVNRWGGEWENIRFGDCAISAVDAFRFLTLAKKPGTNYFDAQMAVTPRAYWRLGENTNSPTSGGILVAADSSGNGRDALYKGAVSVGQTGLLPNEMDHAADFTRGSSGGWVDTPSSALAAGTGDFTWVGLVKPRSFDPAGFDRIWRLLTVGSQNIQIILRADGTIRVFFSDGTNGGTLDTSVSLALNQVSQVAVVKSGTTGPANWKIYVNKVNVSTGASTIGTGNVSVTANTGQIGGFEDSISHVEYGAFDGTIDEVMIVGSALTSTQIGTIYDANFGLNEATLSGDRVNSILDLRNWPAADRAVDAGQFMMQPVVEPLYDTPPLAYIATGEGSLVESEGWPAAFFIAADGKTVFQDRSHAGSAPYVEFADTLVTYYDPGPGPERNDEDIWPQVVLQAVGGQPQTAGDATADQRYGGQTLTRTGLRNADDADVLTMAGALRDRYSTPRDKLMSLTIHPLDEPGVMWPQVLARELNDVITVTRIDLPGGGAMFSGQFRIAGINHQITADDWHCTWELVPA